jgi:hypothetical protein
MPQPVRAHSKAAQQRTGLRAIALLVQQSFARTTLAGIGMYR